MSNLVDSAELMVDVANMAVQAAERVLSQRPKSPKSPKRLGLSPTIEKPRRMQRRVQFGVEVRNNSRRHQDAKMRWKEAARHGQGGPAHAHAVRRHRRGGGFLVHAPTHTLQTLHASLVCLVGHGGRAFLRRFGSSSKSVPITQKSFFRSGSVTSVSISSDRKKGALYVRSDCGNLPSLS